MKLYLFVLLILISFGQRLYSQNQKEISDSVFNKYRLLNHQEKRLIEHKDDDETLYLKLVQLSLINKNRKRYRAKPVKLDILACRMANKMSKEACLNGYTSHWNMLGEKPYHRYAFAGGYDHVSENAYGETTSNILENTNKNRAYLMKKAHDVFMKERKPRDYHKQTCIAKNHNYVGIGMYLTKHSFRYYEEFIDRYYKFSNIPDKIKVNQEFSIEVTVRPRKYLYFLEVFLEKFPEPIKPSVLNKKGGYRDFSSSSVMSMAPWKLAQYRKGNTYNLKFKFSRPGLYYLHMYEHNKEYKQPTSFSTKGKLQASGIVVRVD